MDIFAEHLTTDKIVDQQQTFPPKTVALAMRVLWVLFFPFYLNAIPQPDGERPAYNCTPKTNLSLNFLVLESVSVTPLE